MIKHANFQAVEYVIVTGGNGQVRKKGYGLGFFYNDAILPLSRNAISKRMN